MAKTDGKKKSGAKGGKAVKGKEPERKLIAQNKKAWHDYHILDTYECGLVLTGTEVKSLRQGRASLVDGFAQLDGGEVWLHNVHIPEYAQGTWTNHAARRKRKLLLHREEIDKLIGKTQETGHTLVPLRLYFLRGRAKIELALAKGKKEYDKRQTLREKQDRREADRAMSAARRRQRGTV
ncbi:SsrA-binding protein SmpB [Streptomyces sp. AJS327]|uniref:SsrA-binding protein SmpB n=1 Tax=Streptomyces sp. AJS327 TaxID=2545265 RepID=UPI0015DDE86F|nr:SsrA-binding protein SmpB [Streptomyces sp. AJS327]MBA0049522.1 SsrA-binding protein SmpB [Streptomyces sp. AJS327]